MAISTEDRRPEALKRAWENVENRWDGDPRSPVLESWRAERLEQVRALVARQSVFYSRRAEQLGRQWTGEFTTKADLVEAGLDILAGSVAEAEVYYETTGTTGPPTPCPRGELEVWASNRTLIRAWTSMLAQDGRPSVVAIMGPSELYAFGDVFGAVARTVGVPQVKLWPDSPRVGLSKALRILRQLKVTHVVCAPSMVLELAEVASAAGLSPQDFAIKRFLVLGELSTPEFRSSAESFWPGARVSPAMYGSQEALCVASGWPDGSLRLNELNYHVELVNPHDGAPVAVGQVGELVVTSLIPGLRPMIRFRTGDLVALEPGPLDGYPGRTLTVLGRVADQVLTGDGRRVSAYDVERSALQDLQGCLGYQVLIAGSHQSPEARLRLLVPDPANRTPEVGKALGDLLAMPLTVEFADSLNPRTKTGATASWKAARLVDSRSSR
ncbi:AMP-binding protein [Nocardioides sp. NPDC000445]|uniref:phenylacetate--CoA ligase family protein n=1 Tax=Nocardioides sp. NPDC000445 TaxID=3154257 RepID=UPI00331A5A74